jgi:hypothetical protein
MLDTAVAIAAIATPIAAVLAGFFAILAITHQIRESEKKTRLKVTHESLLKLFDWLSPSNSYQKRIKLLREMAYSPAWVDIINDLSVETWEKLKELKGYRLESIPLLSVEIIKAIDSAVDSIEKIEDIFRDNMSKAGKDIEIPDKPVQDAHNNLNKVLWGIELYLCEFYQSSYNPLSSKKDYLYSKKRINELRSEIDGLKKGGKL